MVSRTGDHRELLRGPTTYGVVIALATVLWWRSLVALIAIVVLCAGDGASGMLGPVFGKHSLPWNRRKSWEGSAFFALFSAVFTVAMHFYFAHFGWTSIPFNGLTASLPYLTRVLALAATTAAVESLPIPDWDNITVFLTSLCMSVLF